MRKTTGLTEITQTPTLKLGGGELSFATNGEVLLASVILQLVFFIVIIAKWIFAKESGKLDRLINMVEAVNQRLTRVEHTMPDEAYITKAVQLEVYKLIHERRPQ